MFYIIEYRWPYERKWIVVTNAEVFGGERDEEVFPLYDKRVADRLKKVFERKSKCNGFSQRGKFLVFRVSLVGYVK